MVPKEGKVINKAFTNFRRDGMTEIVRKTRNTRKIRNTVINGEPDKDITRRNNEKVKDIPIIFKEM